MLRKVALAVMLTACGIWWQIPPAASPADTLPQVHNLILNVTAVDDRGDPVTDLSRDEIQIFDDGKPQSIVTFVPGAAKPVMETPPPATVILFDLLNFNNQNREYVSTFIVKALEPLETADTVYLYLLTNRGEIFPVHGFHETPPPTFLMSTRGAREGESAPTPPWTRQIKPLLDKAIEKVYGIRPESERDVGYRAATTFTALNVLQRAFVQIPGPKTIVWLSSGVTNWPDYFYGCKDMTMTDDTGSFLAGKCTDICRRQTKCLDYEPFFQHFSAGLARANTLIYTAEDLPQGALPPNARGTADDTLRQLADLTGGRMYMGTNMDRAITEAIKNARGRYQISIAAANPNGKHHKLRMKCARKGVRVEGPRRYFADKS
jgi:VWFA-related protein